MTTLTPSLRRALRRIGKTGPRAWRRDYLQDRAATAARIAQLAENGRIAVVENGMDCDCVRYTGWVTILPATTMAVEAWARREQSNAEWPWGFYLERPSEAAEIKRQSRDLALEAFEDGRPHLISTASGLLP
jgi:hypothetical protein